MASEGAQNNEYGVTVLVPHIWHIMCVSGTLVFVSIVQMIWFFVLYLAHSMGHNSVRPDIGTISVQIY